MSHGAMDGNGTSGATVEELIADRLEQSGLDRRASDMVLAALLSEDELWTVISGTDNAASAKQPTPDASAAAPPSGLYLRTIEVEGFRGIGPTAALRLQPGPGLTIVAGRNGSGKSSFAEAAECALTGDNMRWSGRSQVWRDGWRNLHTSGGSRVCVELTADDQPGAIRITRDWAAGAGLDSTESFVQVSGQPRQPLATADWSTPLQLFRPFLSYSELGSLVSGRPSDMYDALQAILGLDQLISAEKRLTEARRRLDDPSKQAVKALPALRSILDKHPDDRARRAATAVHRRPWDLNTVEALAVGADADGDPVVGRLGRVATVELPAAERADNAIGELVSAYRSASDLAGTPSAEARRLASLLGIALAHHGDHPGQPCPVCGGRALDDQWAEATRAEVSLAETTSPERPMRRRRAFRQLPARSATLSAQSRPS